MSDTVITVPNGIAIPVDDLEVQYSYTGDLITSMTVEYEGVTFVKTLSYTGTNLINESQWIQQ